MLYRQRPAPALLRRPLAARALTALTLTAMALTACSSGDGDTGAAAADASRGPDASGLVQAAATGSTQIGSSKFSLTSTTAIGGQDVTFAGEGAFDYVKKTGQLRFAVPGADGSPDGGGTIEQRIIGPDLYLTLPQQAGVFYRLKVADVAGTSLGASTNPTASLEALKGASGVQRVGTETVRGVETTRYEGTYDVAEAIASASGPSKAVLASTLGSTTLEAVPFNAYLDGEGRLVKFEQELELPATPQTGGDVLKSRTVLELYDFDTVVTVTAPPAASVRDGAPLLAALRAALPASPEPSEPAAPAPAGSPRSPAPTASPTR